MTFLNHPTRGKNTLWRSDVYTSVPELEALFENPRKHTSTGYRKSGNAEAGCTQCGERKKRSEFSKNQWIKRKEDKQKCLVCVADVQQLGKADMDSSSKDFLAKDERMRACSSCGGMKLYSDFQSATDNICKECEDNEALLEFADLAISRGGEGDEEAPPGISGTGKGLTSKDLATHNKKNVNFERRQFNCPRHPPQSFIFFKQVPLVKPVAKCPRCKSKKQQGGGGEGGVQGQPRLQPVPRDLEKGYGLFKCLTPGCGSSWGSSRACRSFGQLCLDPRGLGNKVE